jgi:hypothetical protein
VPRGIAAFRVPGDRLISLHVATWHAKPRFVHDDCLCSSTLRTSTPTGEPTSLRVRVPLHFGQTPGQNGFASASSVERDRGHPHRHLVAVGIAQFHRFDPKLPRHGRIDDSLHASFARRFRPSAAPLSNRDHLDGSKALSSCQLAGAHWSCVGKLAGESAPGGFSRYCARGSALVPFPTNTSLLQDPSVGG